jgi:Ca2+-binding RTX toxin-like protein
MATLNFSAAIPELLEWTDTTHFGKKFVMESHAGNTATFLTGDNDGMSITITGTGLTYGKTGELIAGTVQSIVYDYGGDAYLTVKNLSMNAVVAQDSLEFAGTWALLPATAGNDIVNGSSDIDSIFGHDGRDRLNGKAGNDTLDGGDANDRLTGGRGSDTFVFRTNDSGRDVITDFDARGGEGRQDFLRIGSEYNVEKSGNNTLITFGDDDQILLLDVKPSHIDSSDFV